MRKSGEGRRMNLQFCEVLENAMIYTSDLSSALVRGQEKRQAFRMQTHTRSWSLKRIQNVPTTLLSTPKDAPRENSQPFNQGPHQEACHLTRVPPLHLWATTSQLPSLQLPWLVLHLLEGKPQTSKPHLEVVH